ncbi:YciI family protein [Dactylosporangium sp. NPDC000521]|uniref:YciI family protein n=1 Tax=Dactylosporangium sp. NPDC000521 TaxID=3363975 RepID=UPI00368F361B
MQYALLLYGDERVWQEADEAARREIYARHERFMKLLVERGALVGGAELAPTGAATTLRRDGAAVSVTDGPFAETAEQLAGFYLIEAADLDEALALARELPSGVVEVRPMVPGPKESS